MRPPGTTGHPPVEAHSIPLPLSFSVQHLGRTVSAHFPLVAPFSSPELVPRASFFFFFIFAEYFSFDLQAVATLASAPALKRHRTPALGRLAPSGETPSDSLSLYTERLSISPTPTPSHAFFLPTHIGNCTSCRPSPLSLPKSNCNIGTGIKPVTSPDARSPH